MLSFLASEQGPPGRILKRPTGGHYMFSAYQILQARMAKQAHHQRIPSAAHSPVKDELTLNKDLLLCGTGLLSLKACKQRHCIRDTKTCRGATCVWPVLFDGKDCLEVSKLLFKCILPVRKTPLLLKSQCCHRCSQRGRYAAWHKDDILIGFYVTSFLCCWWCCIGLWGIQNCHLSQW